MLQQRLLAPVVLLALLAFPVLGPHGAVAVPSVQRPGPPAYTWSLKPSPVVLRLPRRDVNLRPSTYCWQAPPESTPDGETGAAVCAVGREPSRAHLAKVVASHKVRFWFGRPGWRWTARVTSFAHPDRAGCDVRRGVARVSPQRFDIAVPRHRGTYRVRLSGTGPEGDVAVSFSWRYGRSAGRCS